MVWSRALVVLESGISSPSATAPSVSLSVYLYVLMVVPFATTMGWNRPSISIRRLVPLVNVLM